MFPVLRTLAEPKGFMGIQRVVMPCHTPRKASAPSAVTESILPTGVRSGVRIALTDDRTSKSSNLPVTFQYTH